MKNDIDGKLEKINTDILFYFLLVISSGISFYIINEKKRDILDRSNNSKDVLNKMYIFNRRLIVFVNIYFLINVYNSYKIIICTEVLINDLKKINMIESLKNVE